MAGTTWWRRTGRWRWRCAASSTCWSTTRSTASGSEPEVEELREVSPALVARLGELVRQLSSSAPAPTIEELQEVVASSATRLLVARDVSGEIVGTLTLVVFRLP